ncbi:hypothetical protein LCGC14_1239050 [marine sediment metagenome]|uniref:Uncharacterized protein n=1 Tax=marine sediment metagenome TaxID=412755 RepID=A0A0F9LTJ9_9ZZZZ
MVRNSRVSVGFDDDEYERITVRAKHAHLKPADYIRWYLFKPETITQIQTPVHQIEYTVPYMASEEVIERIKSGKKRYVAPNQKARIENMKKFSKEGGIGELHNSIKVMAHGGKVLKKIPKKDLKDIKKQKEDRKHIANKHRKGIKEKNIEAGILNNDQ